MAHPTTLPAAGRRTAPLPWLGAAVALVVLGWLSARYGHTAYLDAVPRRLNHCLKAGAVPAAAWAGVVAGPVLALAGLVLSARQLRAGGGWTAAAGLLAAVAALVLLVDLWGLVDVVRGLDHPARTCSG
ncbi:hypothetical protein AB0D08_28450 [Kitasatospora sp. NPDC048540]|uniref:hypothetical protein n=1 Tax=unclassified Kitasatospora TaxID=2633591 RepID=UPI00053B5CA6|nr:hypothetical protein [Kitasatospora sp. MBT63]